MKCKFCGKEAELLEGIYVCNECCTVSFSNDIELAQKQKLITEYLNNIQKQLLEHQDCLHTIEQKHISGEELSECEFEIYNKITEFHSVCLELHAYIKSNSQLKEKNERNSLYRLLILSKWISIFLGWK